MNQQFQNPQDSHVNFSGRPTKRPKSFAEKSLWTLSFGLLIGYSLWHFDMLPIEIGLAPSGELANKNLNPLSDQKYELSEAPHAEIEVFKEQSEPDFEPAEVITNNFANNNDVLKNLTPERNNPFAVTAKNNAVKKNSPSSPKLIVDTMTVDKKIIQTAMNDKQGKIQTLSYNPKRTPVKLIQKPYTEGSVEIQQLSGETPTKLIPSAKESSLSPAEQIKKHRELSSEYWANPDIRASILPELEAMARSIYFSNKTHFMKSYTVQPGEQLRTIAKKYDVPWQYLARLNRVTPEKLKAGQTLKVIRGPFSAVVDQNDYQLTIHAHGYFVAKFPVGLGKGDSTPVGKFPVKNKELNPVYYGPDGIVSADDPANPLGERWIDLGDSYGIHGTINPKSIGRNESKGCVRMHNKDVEIVYDLLTVGSEVQIR